MNKFKLNQRVYCKSLKLYGIIVDVNYNGYYPIVVDFYGGECLTYTKDGRYHFNSPISLINPLKDKINKLLEL